MDYHALICQSTTKKYFKQKNKKPKEANTSLFCHLIYFEHKFIVVKSLLVVFVETVVGGENDKI